MFVGKAKFSTQQVRVHNKSSLVSRMDEDLCDGQALNVNFNLSPLTISSLIASNSLMSQLQLIYRPLNQSLLFAESHTWVSEGSAGVSTKMPMSSSGTHLTAMGDLIVPGLTAKTLIPREGPMSLCKISLIRTSASLLIYNQNMKWGCGGDH